MLRKQCGEGSRVGRNNSLDIDYIAGRGIDRLHG